MTCFDVRILATLEQAAPPEEWALLETHRLPDSASVRGDAPERHIEPPRWEVEVALGNLARLGCLHPAPALGGVMNFGLVRLTRLGISFIRVCSRAPD
jgi:hypothetical protein